MKSDDVFLDLDKAKNWIDKAAAERITVDPRRANFDENNQINNLIKIIPDVAKPNKKTYIVNGKLYENKSSIAIVNPSDLDAISISNNWIIVWTLKGGQEIDGTAQTYQFENVIKTINHAPNKLSTEKVILSVLVNGNFWIKSRPRLFKGYEKNTDKRPFNLIDILRFEAKDKKCIIFSDEMMPVIPDNSSFYESYIKGNYDHL